MMRFVYRRESFFQGLEQLFVVAVLQTISQGFFQAESISVAVAQCEQQRNDGNLKNKKRKTQLLLKQETFTKK